MEVTLCRKENRIGQINMSELYKAGVLVQDTMSEEDGKQAGQVIKKTQLKISRVLKTITPLYIFSSVSFYSAKESVYQLLLHLHLSFKCETRAMDFRFFIFLALTLLSIVAFPSVLSSPLVRSYNSAHFSINLSFQEACVLVQMYTFNFFARIVPRTRQKLLRMKNSFVPWLLLTIKRHQEGFTGILMANQYWGGVKHGVSKILNGSLMLAVYVCSNSPKLEHNCSI